MYKSGSLSQCSFITLTRFKKRRKKSRRNDLPFLKAPATDTTTTFLSFTSSLSRISFNASTFGSNVWSSCATTTCKGFPRLTLTVKTQQTLFCRLRHRTMMDDSYNALGHWSAVSCWNAPTCVYFFDTSASHSGIAGNFFVSRKIPKSEEQSTAQSATQPRPPQRPSSSSSVTWTLLGSPHTSSLKSARVKWRIASRTDRSTDRSIAARRFFFVAIFRCYMFNAHARDPQLSVSLAGARPTWCVMPCGGRAEPKTKIVRNLSRWCWCTWFQLGERLPSCSSTTTSDFSWICGASE